MAEFNSLLMAAFRCNSNIKPVVNASAIFYITDYLTKNNQRAMKSTVDKLCAKLFRATTRFRQPAERGRTLAASWLNAWAGHNGWHILVGLHTDISNTVTSIGASLASSSGALLFACCN